MTPAYEAIRPQLDTGDLVLFAGRGFVSGLIRFFTKSSWSHIGMVFRTDPDLLLLWESTTLSNLKDMDCSCLRQGVQLVSLSDRIASYDGQVGIRRLEGFERTPDLLARLTALRDEIKDRPYESSTLALIRSAYEGIAGLNIPDLSSLFCSELVAEAYLRMGLLEPGIAASEYSPEDFAWRYVVLEGGITLSDIVIVKGDE